MQQTQKITAYKVQVYQFRKSEVLKIGKEEGMIDIAKILDEFLSSVKTTIKLDSISRAIRLKEDYAVQSVKDYTRRSGWFYAGQYGKKGLIENLDDDSIKELKPSDVHFMQHFVFFYINENSPSDECYFLFHRYSTGGAKTVFFDAFRKYIRETYQLNIKESTITDVEMIVKENGSIPEMKLIRHTTKVVRSSDQSENVSGHKIKSNSVEYETKLYLTNPNIKDKAKAILGLKDSKQKIDKIHEIVELKRISQSEDEEEYFDYKIRVELFGKKRWVHIDEIEKLYFEYDVTTQLEYEDEYPKYTSLAKVANEYFERLTSKGEM